MKLLSWENYELKISEEALLVKDFRLLWTRDRSATKIRAMDDFAYLYFMYDPRSSYLYIVDESERLKTIREQIGLKKTWKVDKKLLRAAKTYQELCITSSARLLASSRIAIEKVKAFLEDVDLTLVDDKGKPIYTVNSIVSALKDIPRLIQQMNEIEKIVNSELQDTSRMRGQGEKKLLEDGDY